MEPTPEEVARRRRALAQLGYLLALVGVVGLILNRDLVILWAFLIAFGLAEIPRGLWRKWRVRRKREHKAP